MLAALLFIVNTGMGYVVESSLTKAIEWIKLKLKERGKSIDELNKILYESFREIMIQYKPDAVLEKKAPEWWLKHFSVNKVSTDNNFITESERLKSLIMHNSTDLANNSTNANSTNMSGNTAPQVVSNKKFDFNDMIELLDEEPLDQFFVDILEELKSIPELSEYQTIFNKKGRGFLRRWFNAYIAKINNISEFTQLKNEFINIDWRFDKIEETLRILDNKIDRLGDGTEVYTIDTIKIDKTVNNYIENISIKSEEKINEYRALNRYFFDKRDMIQTLKFHGNPNEKDETRKKDNYDLLKQIINNYSRTQKVFITGHMGYGKTVLSWWMIQQLTKKYNDETSQILPIRLSCRSIDAEKIEHLDANDAVKTLIKSEFLAQGILLKENELEWLLENKAILLIFDGYDEAGSTVVNFISRIKGHSLVVLSRPYALKPGQDVAKDVPVEKELPGNLLWYAVKELSQEMIEIAIKQYHGGNITFEHYKEYFGDNTNKWLSNPLYLRIILLQPENKLETINSEFDLLREVVWDLITRELIKHISPETGTDNISDRIDNFWNNPLANEEFQNRVLLETVIDEFFKLIAMSITFGFDIRKIIKINNGELPAPHARDCKPNNPFFENPSSIIDVIATTYPELNSDIDNYKKLINKLSRNFWLVREGERPGKRAKGYIFEPDRFRDFFVIDYIRNSGTQDVWLPLVWGNTSEMGNFAELLISMDYKLFPDSYSHAYQRAYSKTVYEFAQDLKELNVNTNNVKEFILRKGEIIAVYLSKYNLTSLPNSIGDLSNLQELNLFKNDLTYLPDTIGNLSNLKELNLRSNYLISLPDTIGNLSNLKVLNLYENILTYLPDSIGNLSNLTSLEVWGNNLTSLPDSIGNLSNLTSLDVWGNNLTSLPDSIGNLSNITYLNVSSNKLTSLPDWIGNLSNLQELILGGIFRGNNLTSLPDWIGNLSNLQALVVGGNKLTSLPDTIVNLSKLTSLDISYNELITLPASIGNLSNITYLNVSSNKLTSLPDWIGNLSKLIYLDLESNNLTSLPDTIGNLSNLQKLILYKNKLTSLPDTIGNLSNLKVLNLYENILTYLPETIGNLSNLQRLDVSYNNLTSLPDNIGNLSNITYLNVSSNKLTFLPDSIGNLSNITYLNVEGNKLTSIPASIGNLSNLTSLNVEGNKLTSIPASIGNLSKLEILYLSRNELTSLPDSIGNLSKLEILYLSRNGLTSLPDWIGNLSNLTYLNLDWDKVKLPKSISNCKKITELKITDRNITSLHDSIGNLSNLKELDLRSNKLTSIPASIGNLSKLEILYLSRNELTSLPDSIGNLSKLIYLDLESNNLTSLPDSIGNLSNLKELDLSDNSDLELTDSTKEALRKLMEHGCSISGVTF